MDNIETLTQSTSLDKKWGIQVIPHFFIQIQSFDYLYKE
jgi:hypothetical protein